MHEEKFAEEYMKLQNDKDFFEKFKGGLDPERIINIGFLSAEPGSKVVHRSVAVKDATFNEINVSLYGSHCSQIAREISEKK